MQMCSTHETPKTTQSHRRAPNKHKLETIIHSVSTLYMCMYSCVRARTAPRYEGARDLLLAWIGHRTLEPCDNHPTASGALPSEAAFFRAYYG